ncbi:DUF2577 domain-containing protein [Metaclostridioides mangenotii]|uniref:DUF2577 domain-containing protein n=1 Tax=Metaclostridioides mangenotii TaxID=1540 RepID=UPI0028E2B6EA|nr:DUF2577 domain-containing protein [Clostridioides mangenotii]
MAADKLVQALKKAAIEAVNEAQPMGCVFGLVTKKSPLNIQIDSKLNLTSTFLMLTETSKKIDYKIGNKVLLIKMQGGQKYIVIDRM